MMRKKRRFLGLTITAFFFFLLVGFILSRAVPFTAQGQGEVKVIEVTIQEGDTLWSIARRYYPQESDLRRHIHQIQEWNQIQGGLVQPNQTIKIILLDKIVD